MVSEQGFYLKAVYLHQLSFMLCFSYLRRLTHTIGLLADVHVVVGWDPANLAVNAVVLTSHRTENRLRESCAKS